MTIKFADMSFEAIDELCKAAKREGGRVMIEINAYKKELYWDPDENVEKEDEVVAAGSACEIRSSKDIFQFGDDMKLKKLLDKETKKKLR